MNLESTLTWPLSCPKDGVHLCRRRHYNEERPHMSLGDLTPAEFKAQIGTTHRWL